MYFKQVDEIISGAKTQTRRVCKPGEAYLFLAADGRQYKWMPDNGSRHATEQETILDVYNRNMHRLKWQVGRDYAVSPGRGKKTVVYNMLAPEWHDQRDGWYLIEGIWIPLRIVITDIRRERLQDISESDARAEGYVCPDGVIDNLVDNMAISWYRSLWESINGRGSWDANPDVWVLTFRVKQ